MNAPVNTAVNPIGIHDITFATGHHSFALETLADKHGIDVGKFHKGIGQEVMSQPAADEDIVTIAATAAKRIIDRNGTDGIRTLLFATESGVDQSKSAGVYVHGLLGLPAQVRTIEMKQACYSGVGALQVALGIVARNPQEKVLVVASDVARYDLNSGGEPTQGAAAAAFLVQVNPGILAVEPASGVYTYDVQDFWRPNDRHTALVDGKLSIDAYLNAVRGAYDDFIDHSGADFAAIDRFCYHQPFTKMAVKAHMALREHVGLSADKAETAAELETTMHYNRMIGNSYTASVFLALMSLLETESGDLAGKRVGVLSYGSGAVAEFFTGTIVDGYQKLLHADEHKKALDSREPLTYDAYRDLHPGTRVADITDYDTPEVTDAPFRFAGVKDHSRIYQRR